MGELSLVSQYELVTVQLWVRREPMQSDGDVVCVGRLPDPMRTPFFVRAFRKDALLDFVKRQKEVCDAE